jgi:hypothetical protein
MGVALRLRSQRPPHPAAERGVALHLLLEEFFKGSSYPSGNRTLAPWQPFMERLRTFNPHPELEVAVTKDWSGIEYDHPEAYLRGKLDLAFSDNNDVRHLFDWKSGKVYPDHESQGKTYVAMDHTDPEAYEVRFVYLDQPGLIKSWIYTPRHRQEERHLLVEIIETISEDKTYEPTPSHDGCRYCPLSWRRGGNCTRAP